MILLFILFFAFFLFMTFTVYYGIKFSNLYKLYLIFGKKGTGKSTTMVMLSYKYNRKGYKVYCTDDSVPETYTFDPSYFGNYKFDEKSVVLMDEVSLLWSNRDFKSFSRDIEKQFRFQRKDRLIIYLFSQTFDVDKKIRDLVDCMYLAEKRFNCITWLKKIAKNPTITEADSKGESRVTENLEFEPFIFWPFGSRILVWIPRWVKYFDSFSTFGWDREPMPAEYTYPLSSRSSSSGLSSSRAKSARLRDKLRFPRLRKQSKK